MATAVLLAVLLPTAGALSAQSRQGLLSLPEGRLFYEVVGTGDPIFVVHGGPGLDHRYLRPGLDVLASSHALVYYDQRGTGRPAPIAMARALAEAFPQGRFVPLDSGHFPCIEDPQGLAEAVSGFLAGLGGG
jgi:pimeloyl-ACP methyl ester carboxylesterase